MRSGQYKLIDTVNYLISLLAKRCNQTVEDYVRKTGICDVMKTSKLQCLSFMYNIMFNLNYLPFFSVTCNNLLHVHNTRSSGNIHINRVTTPDQINFMYHYILH